jgi:hypothetical protein
MWELFCPQHGIPAFLMWAVLGGDPQILCLTFQMYRDKVTSLIRRIA